MNSIIRASVNETAEALEVAVCVQNFTHQVTLLDPTHSK